MQLDEIVRLEEERKKARLWVPTLPVFMFFWSTKWSGTADIDREDDEDPGELFVTILVTSVGGLTPRRYHSGNRTGDGGRPWHGKAT